jgi:hypothetical protein
VDLELIVSSQLIKLLKEFKDIFAWTYKDLKRIPLGVAQHWIELDTSIPLAHQTRYWLNLNYVAIVKHDIDKLFVTVIKPIGKATWPSPVVIVLKKMGN